VSVEASRAGDAWRSPGRDPEVLLRAALVAAIFGAIALAAALPASPPGAPLVLAGHPVPTLCLTRSLFGVRCPGCGLTRSWIDLLHGHWRDSFAQHPFGAVTLLYVLGQLARQLGWLLSSRRRTVGATRATRALDRAGLALLLLLFATWPWRLH
jgi:Protein of unknown function (DUF2752)